MRVVITKGTPPRVGEIARLLAATPRPIVINGVSTSPVLLRTYLATLSECAAVNDCALCRRELDKLARAVEAGVPRGTPRHVSET